MPLQLQQHAGLLFPSAFSLAHNMESAAMHLCGMASAEERRNLFLGPIVQGIATHSLQSATDSASSSYA